MTGSSSEFGSKKINMIDSK